MTYNQMVAPLKEYAPNVNILLYGDTQRYIMTLELLDGIKFEDWIPLYTAFIEVGFTRSRWN